MPDTALSARGKVLAHATVQPAATGHPAYSQTMPCEPASARRARTLVEAALHTWRLSGYAQTAMLVMSELVGNAVAHSDGCRIRVTVSRPTPRRVRVAVIDRSRTAPARRGSVDGLDEDGRGLVVVEEIAQAWGTDRLPWGKRVWAEISEAR